MPNEVLIVAAHPDDEVLGTGGVIAKHVGDGDGVTVLILCGREYDRVHSEEVNAEEWLCTLEAQKILGYQRALHPTPMLPDGDLDITSIRDIIAPIEEVCESFEPDIAYIPFGEDVHQDHQAVFKACMIAMRPISKHKVRKILAYEVPSTTDQNPYFHSFRPNVYVDIDSTERISKKRIALACYKREMQDYPHPRSQAGMEIYARFRGLQSGFIYAEAFMLIREMVD